MTAPIPTVALSMFLLAASLAAQNAELSGLITDPSGLAVSGARVVVQSADTGGTRTVSSNQQGEYSVPALLPGPYNITTEANGGVLKAWLRKTPAWFAFPVETPSLHSSSVRRLASPSNDVLRLA
jgi:protocatechuate 3,4-dioxygenase beta subunit